MADFPPAQYIDGYSATGNTISFTIAGYTKKKVASLTLTDGGSYSTPSASVAFSGGSGSGASATASMGIKSISVASVGSADLLNTTSPETVGVTVEGNAEVAPIFGLGSALINADLYYDIATTPTIAVTGENGAYTDAVATLNSTSTLSVASLNLPTSSTPASLPYSASLSMKIVEPSATGTVLGMATMTTDDDGIIDGVDVVSWATATSKSTLQGLSLALYHDSATKYTVTGITANVPLFVRVNGDAPSIGVTNLGTTTSEASIILTSNNIVPKQLRDIDPSTLDQLNTVYTGSGNFGDPSSVPVGTVSSGVITYTGPAVTRNTIASNNSWTVVNALTDPVWVFSGLYSSGFSLNPNPSYTFNYDGGGLFSTNSFTVVPQNIYTDVNCTVSATNADFTLTSSLYTILTSATTIGSVKIATETSPSRISVGTIGTGYTSLIQITPTGLYTNSERLNLATSTSFTVNNRLNGVSVSNAGSGYITAPAVTFTGGGITNLNATKTLAYKVVSTNVNIGGLDFVTAPTATFSGTLSSGGANATATAVLSTNPVISLPNLTESEADLTTGDSREICHALCELANTIDTTRVSPSIQTTLQTGGAGVIDRFTFVFDLAPESGILAVESES